MYPGRFLRQSILAVSFVGLTCVYVSCGGDHSDLSTDTSAIVVRSNTGEIYNGRGVRDLVLDGKIPSLDYEHPFYRVSVPISDLDAIDRGLTTVRSYSLEDEDSGVSVYLRRWEGGRLENTEYLAGAPWLSGMVQLYKDSERGTVNATYQILRYQRSGELEPLSISEISLGLVPDANAPSLKYVGNPANWPPLPENWN